MVLAQCSKLDARMRQNRARDIVVNDFHYGGDSAHCDDVSGFLEQCCGLLTFSSEIDLLMYSTFAVQSGRRLLGTFFLPGFLFRTV